MAIEITVPRLGWSMEEGSFSGWLKKDGEQVNPGDLLFALEGDKTTQEIESLDGGILRIPPGAPKPGDAVKVGQLLAYLVSKGEPLPTRASASLPAQSISPTVAEANPRSAVAAKTTTGAGSHRKPPVTPRARRAAAELGIDPSSLEGTGKGGRVRERDVRNAIREPSGHALSPIDGTTEEVAPTSLRRTIAARMLRSRQSTAPVTLTCRADATNLAGLRRHWSASSGGGSGPTYTDIVVKVVGAVLQRHPALASRWEDDRIVPAKAIDIGIAVDTERGLLVPVIRDVPSLSLAEVAKLSRQLIEAARAGRARPEDLQGGVFTVTNLGAFGVEAFTPIINFPEAAILGLGEIRPQVVVLADGQLAARDQMTLSLTFDHRIVDGAPAARFLQSVRQGIEGLEINSAAPG